MWFLFTFLLKSLLSLYFPIEIYSIVSYLLIALPLDWAIQLWATSWLLYHVTELFNCELPLHYSTTWLSYSTVTWPCVFSGGHPSFNQGFIDKPAVSRPLVTVATHHSKPCRAWGRTWRDSSTGGFYKSENPLQLKELSPHLFYLKNRSWRGATKITKEFPSWPALFCSCGIVWNKSLKKEDMKTHPQALEASSHPSSLYDQASLVKCSSQQVLNSTKPRCETDPASFLFVPTSFFSGGF